MAWPCTAAIDRMSLRRHQVNASWYSVMVASSSGNRPPAEIDERQFAVETLGVNACRSGPAGKDFALGPQHHDSDRSPAAAGRPR